MNTSIRWSSATVGAVCAMTGLALFAAPLPTLAQQAPAAATSPAPETTSSPAPTGQASPQAAPQGPDPHNGVFGDFGGSRTALANKGISFFGRYAGEFAGTGGSPNGTAYASEFQLGANIDFAKMHGGGAGGILHFIGTERWGSSLSSNVIGNIASVQEIFGDGSTTRLTELDYEQPIADNKLNVKFGRVIMQNDFAAGSSYWAGNLWCFYQSNAICGTPVGVPNNSGYGFYPSSEWGARLKVQPSKTFYIEAGAYQVNPTYSARFHGFDFSDGKDTGVDFPVETGMTFRDGDGTAVGNFRVGGYFDTSNVLGAENALGRFVASNNPALGQISQQRYRGREGFYVLTDHLIEGSALPGKAGTAFFAAYEFGDPQTAVISSFADAGIVRHGTFSNRPNDTIALGFAYIDVNGRLRNFESTLQNEGFAVPTTGQEKIVELNYGMQLSKSIVLRPGLQYVINPSGEQNVLYPGGALGLKNTLVFGLGTNIAF